MRSWPTELIVARKALGDNWSGWVSVKSGHELVQSGPYRHLRHPVYTGGLLGLLVPFIYQLEAIQR